MREPLLGVAAALLVPISIAGIATGTDPAWLIVLGVVFVGGQALLSMLPRWTTVRPGFGLWVARALLLVAFVTTSQLLTGATLLLALAYMPIVAMSAAYGRPQAVIVVVAVIVGHLLARLADPFAESVVLWRALTVGFVSLIMVVGTTAEVSRLRMLHDGLRRAVRNDRRRARQMAGVEAVGRILASGPTSDALGDVARRISDEMHYQRVSIYLTDGDTVRLTAQEGDVEPMQTGSSDPPGLVARVASSRSPALASDVTATHGCSGLDAGVRSQICVPLIADGELLGVVDVQAAGPQPLDTTDLRAIVAIADRIATGLVLGRERQHLAEMVVRDPLTGLFNRRHFDPALDQLFAQRARLPEGKRPPLAAIMFDLDHFSDVNNRFGHQVGDAVLRAFADLLRGRVRATDLVARFGGEEFAVILYQSGLEDAVRVADDVRRQMAARTVELPDGEVVVATVSAGCSVAGGEIDGPRELLRRTDVALYMAKRGGRNQVVAA